MVPDRSESRGAAISAIRTRKKIENLRLTTARQFVITKNIEIS